MRCPSLAELPAPPPGKTGFPWTEESRRPAESRSLCRITVITPSFNQGRFLEETIRSILLQGYPELEYFVLDGGSSDNSVEIIRKYSQWISFWVSEPDGGQSAAINRGLRMGSGAYATWINSDDMLCKDALVSHEFDSRSGDSVYIGDCVIIDEAGRFISTHRGHIKSFEDLLRIDSFWRSGGSIDQPAVLFPLELARRVGGLNEENHFTMDYELWGKFLLHGANFRYTQIPFGVFRWYSGQKTQEGIHQTESLLDAAEALLQRADSLPLETRQEIDAALQAYRKAYPAKLWKQSGRLARMGLPPSVVLPLRSMRRTVAKTVHNFMRSAESSE